MGSEMTVCFYLLIGIGVAVALWIGNDSRSGVGLFQTISAPFFWPMYVPVLLARRTDQMLTSDFAATAGSSKPEADGMASLITQVESELDAALRSLNGWAENVLSGEQHRIAELRTAWRQQASHIRELDRLLTQKTVETPPPVQKSNELQAVGQTESQAPAESSADVTDPSPAMIESDTANEIRMSEFERSRAENITKLKQLRRQMYDDLMATLAWVRELVTMIHLAKFTGAPASRALELVRQIAAAVEGLSNVNRSTPPTTT